MCLKTWRVEYLFDKHKEYFIRIDTKYLDNSQHIGDVVKVKALEVYIFLLSQHNFYGLYIPRNDYNSLIDVFFISQEDLAKNSCHYVFKFATSSFSVNFDKIGWPQQIILSIVY